MLGIDRMDNTVRDYAEEDNNNPCYEVCNLMKGDKSVFTLVSKCIYKCSSVVHKSMEEALYSLKTNLVNDRKPAAMI